MTGNGVAVGGASMIEMQKKEETSIRWLHSTVMAQRKRNHRGEERPISIITFLLSIRELKEILKWLQKGKVHIHPPEGKGEKLSNEKEESNKVTSETDSRWAGVCLLTVERGETSLKEDFK